MKRRSNRIDHSALLPCFGILGRKRAHTRRNSRVFAGEVGADGLPRLSAVSGFEQYVRGEIKSMRIDRREEGWLGAISPILRVTHRNGRHVLRLPSGPMILRNLAATASVNNVGVKWIGSDVPVLDGGDGMPVAKCDFAVIASAQNAHRAALLLSSTNTVGKSIGDSNVVKLCRRLVVPRAPGFSTIDSHDRALIADHNNNLRVIGIDPEILIVISAGRPTNAHPGLAAIRRPHHYDAHTVDHVRVFRIDS